MGVLFKVSKINTTKIGTKTLSHVEVDSTAPQPTPIMSIVKLDRTGTAQKLATPYINSSKQYVTSWVPMGQDGWKILLQVILKYHEDTGVDEIGSWLDINTGQLLYVESNQCNKQGFIQVDGYAVKKLPNGSLWYIDKITIKDRHGVSQLADMELTLYKCWTEVSA